MKTFDVTEFTKLLNEKVRGREYTEARLLYTKK